MGFLICHAYGTAQEMCIAESDADLWAKIFFDSGCKIVNQNGEGYFLLNVKMVPYKMVPYLKVLAAVFFDEGTCKKLMDLIKQYGAIAVKVLA